MACQAALERMNRSECRGWLALNGIIELNEENFLVISNGQNWVENVSIFNRKVINQSQNNKKLGFEIKLKKGLKKTAKVSVFYKYKEKLIHIKPIPKLVNPITNVSEHEFIQNQFVADSLRLGRLVVQPELLNKIFEPKLQHLTVNEYSPTFVKVGTLSHKNTAIVGKEGHLFLYGGSNKVDRLYDVQQDSAEKFADAWVKLIEKRHEKFSQKNISFIQLSIPEKQSIYPERYFRNISGLTPNLATLEQRQPISWFSAYDCLMKHRHEEIYFNTDSHLNSVGSMRLFEGLLAYQALPPIPSTNKIKSGYALGDLGAKFTPQMAEKTEIIAPFSKGQVKNTVRFIPANKGHLGREYIWTNDKPLSERSIMIFGNSFFDAGTHPRHLTWWFNQYFRYVHFIWSISPDWKLIDKHKPDLVICQTIERFMRKTPKH